MILGQFRFFNPLLAWFGLKIIETRLGQWHVTPRGGLYRTTILVGYRLARRGEWSDHERDNERTELDRFVHRHKAGTP